MGLSVELIVETNLQKGQTLRNLARILGENDQQTINIVNYEIHGN